MSLAIRSATTIALLGLGLAACTYNESPPAPAVVQTQPPVVVASPPAGGTTTVVTPPAQ